MTNCFCWQTTQDAAPAVVVIPANERDLRIVVQFATKYRIRLVPKCSGACGAALQASFLHVCVVWS